MPHIPYDIERAIRERAHEIWMQEGCPEDRAEAHWHQARAEIEAAVAEQRLDTEVADSFPASDPPSHSGITGAGTTGSGTTGEPG
jgi:hypothetical protein